jgi:hypothetical protein
LDGNLFVASNSSHSVYRLRPNGEFGVFIPSGTGGMAWPRFLAFEAENGLLYVTADHSVLRFNPTNGSFVDEFATTGPDAGPMDIVFIPSPCDPCDMNCDGIVNAFDIEPFLELLFDPNAVPCAECTGDVNGDGTIDAFDIEPFLMCLFP